MTPEDMHRITGVTPSQESPEVRRQLQEDQRGGDWLGWVLLAMAVFLVFVMVIWFGSYWMLSIDLSHLTLHPDCPTRAC